MILLVTHGWKDNHFGGRQQYSRCLIQSLKKNNSENLNIYKISPYKKINIIDKFFNLNVDFISSKDVEDILNIIKSNKINLVIIDASSFGFLCKKIKNLSKQIRIIVIYHHIEFNFFIQLFYSTKNPLKLFLAIKMYINEFLSSKFSDKQIFFTIRDKNYGKSLYKSKNPEILPIAQPFSEPKNFEEKSIIEKPYVLFIGGGKLLPNYTGILWFIENVLPKIDLELIVIGSGYDELIKKNFKNVTFLGKVDDTTSIYKKAKFAIAPIFGGSGMKTKIAEAASFGKIVFGTTEAIHGYEKFINKICIRCDNEKEFISNINIYKKLSINSKEVSDIYKKNYSVDAMNYNFTKLIKNLIQLKSNDI